MPKIKFNDYYNGSDGADLISAKPGETLAVSEAKAAQLLGDFPNLCTLITDESPKAAVAYKHRASILIPCIENYEFTAQVIQDIRKNTAGEYEIIIIDNGSKPATKKRLAGLIGDNDKMISAPKNYGFPRGMNYGIAAATGEYIVLMNNDVRLPKGWLDRLLAPFADPLVGVASPLRTIVDENDMIRILKPSGHPPTAADEPYVKSREVATLNRINKKQMDLGAGVFYTNDMVAFFCVALTRKAIATVGYFDEDYGLGLCEDVHYCRLLIQNGFKIAINTELFCLHLTSRTIIKVFKDRGRNEIAENHKLMNAKLAAGAVNTHKQLRPLGVEQ